MIDINSITFIIPVFNLQGDRLENFKFVLNSICQISSKVIVVEQCNSASSSNVSELVTGYNINYIRVDIDDTYIHKSRLINTGASIASTKFIWINDADCYLKFANVLKAADDSFNFIQPYSVAKLLDKNDSELIRNNKSIKIEFDCENIGQSVPKRGDFIALYGALSFIANKDAFNRIGGMCEDYTGWGLEDDDLCYRAIKDKFNVIKSSYGIHLYHPPSDTKNTARKNNEAIYSQRFGKPYLDLSAEIKKFYKRYYDKKISIYGIPRSGTTYLMARIAAATQRPHINEPTGITYLEESPQIGTLEEHISGIDNTYDIIKSIYYYGSELSNKFNIDAEDFKERVLNNLILGDNKNVIFVTRYNFIEWLASILLAYNENNWIGSTYSTEEINITKYQFEHNYEKWYNWHFVELPAIQKICDDRSIKYATIDYSQIFDNVQRKKLIDDELDIDLDNVTSKLPNKQKNKPGHLYIKNHEEVKNYFVRASVNTIESILMIRFNLTRDRRTLMNLDEQWLLSRIEMFKMCLKSLKSQTDQNFKAVILMHPDTPIKIQNIMEDLLSSHANIITYYIDCNMWLPPDQFNIKRMLRYCNMWPKHRMITIWHDSDDILSKTAIEKLKYSLSQRPNRSISCFPHGIKTEAVVAQDLLDNDSDNGFLFSKSDASNTYFDYRQPKKSTCMGMISTRPDWSHIFMKGHQEWHNIVNVTDINDDIMFCKILSNSSVVNRLDTHGNIQRTNIINSIIFFNNKQSYLEIGLGSEDNFFNINCENKIGIDILKKKSPNSIQISSDDFFASNTDKYDIIFIDGDHHEDQFMRDVSNSLECLEEGGVILCHDISPRSKAEQNIPREDAAGSWTGDVWKGWAKLRSRADINLYTLNIETGLGLIFKEPNLNIYNAPVDLDWEFLDSNRRECLNLVDIKLPVYQLTSNMFSAIK